MKNYKEYETKYIGTSDYATLILVGCDSVGLYLYDLSFGIDGSYRAYIVDSDCEIPDYYQEEATFNSWLKVYDDDSLVCNFQSKEIKVYRAGDMGCIIQLID